jgi:hypothetical protein
MEEPNKACHTTATSPHVGGVFSWFHGFTPVSSFAVAGSGVCTLTLARRMKNADSSVGPWAVALQKIPKSESSVIRVGEVGVLRGSGVIRLASLGSCVIPVGDIKSQRDFRVSRLPIHDPPDTQASLRSFRSRVPQQDRLTRR